MSTNCPKADRTEITRAISLLFKSGDVVEVRIPKTRFAVVSGYFDNFAVMAEAIYKAGCKVHGRRRLLRA